MTGALIHKLGSDDAKPERALQLLVLFHEALAGEPPRSSPKYLGRLLAKLDFYAIVAVREGVAAGGLTL